MKQEFKTYKVEFTAIAGSELKKVLSLKFCLMNGLQPREEFKYYAKRNYEMGFFVEASKIYAFLIENKIDYVDFGK